MAKKKGASTRSSSSSGRAKKRSHGTFDITTSRSRQPRRRGSPPTPSSSLRECTRPKTVDVPRKVLLFPNGEVCETDGNGKKVKSADIVQVICPREAEAKVVLRVHPWAEAKGKTRGKPVKKKFEEHSFIIEKGVADAKDEAYEGINMDASLSLFTAEVERILITRGMEICDRDEPRNMHIRRHPITKAGFRETNPGKDPLDPIGTNSAWSLADVALENFQMHIKSRPPPPERPTPPDDGDSESSTDSESNNEFLLQTEEYKKKLEAYFARPREAEYLEFDVLANAKETCVDSDEDSEEEDRDRDGEEHEDDDEAPDQSKTKKKKAAAKAVNPIEALKGRIKEINVTLHPPVHKDPDAGACVTSDEELHRFNIGIQDPSTWRLGDLQNSVGTESLRVGRCDELMSPYSAVFIGKTATMKVVTKLISSDFNVVLYASTHKSQRG